MNLKSFGKALVRRKKIDTSPSSSALNRCLTTFDLTALGIGSTLGLGMYVISGNVAGNTAGPAVVFSFLFAAIASVLAGFCYAEFGARVPKAGSAYIYSYVTVGEFIAFVIGWNMLLEYVIGAATVARGYSNYLDVLFNKTMSSHFRKWMPMDVPHMSEYPDLFAFVLTIGLSIMLAAGVKESTRFNGIFTTINLSIVTFVVICGSFKIDFNNWALEPGKDNLPKSAGTGGFFPFGFSGMMSGASTCFFSFVGFDVIATTGEEANNPQKSIPIAIVLSLLVSFLAYFGVSAIQTLICPYYLLTDDAPLPLAFEIAGLSFARWFITIGVLAGLSASLLGAMFPMPRVLYSMASDGLIFRFFAHIHPRTQSPLVATLTTGLFAGLMAVFFNVGELADMMSIGTLLAYTLVSVSILILRYEPSIVSMKSHFNRRFSSKSDSLIASECEPLTQSTSQFDLYDVEKEPCDDSERAISPESDSGPESPTPLTNNPGFLPVINKFRMRVFNSAEITLPNRETSLISKFLITIICGNITLLDLLLVTLEKNLSQLDKISLIVVGASLAYLISLVIALYRQPQANASISFQVPWVPFIPIISIFINIYLMMKLTFITWIRFAVWLLIGLSIYLFYGIRNSKERKINDSFQIAPVSYKSKEPTLS
ncbi:cationic amino acid transporter 2 isoform X1 [Tetranychus urticae]|uniref:cationic amino acid transporter 2 isoform X1 n=1 Tax=Tetranychus urticae TaxID=32264 RepID=UPI00077B8D90|nr:cationic amino acid transporter 2 isoform X1 [Tetranychus urticae]XP_015788654.1 cationic amino acid transporter 2 isoform X1 [Tetranychus urticae]XP_015788655.1 cationic amino acid transporter 2 isoform X1 [Tetranychus urticae]XP_015788656.1 cationic amino acid transporter 2 isoform X1 [Tetranychus urticae]XP_025017254.1 cationic amino acid transporter 2 isoform X1 [Tetranychus urticae]